MQTAICAVAGSAGFVLGVAFSLKEGHSKKEAVIAGLAAAGFLILTVILF
jgi:hypothetical protein